MVLISSQFHSMLGIFMLLLNKCKNSLILGLGIALFLDVTGNGFYETYRCIKKYPYERCLWVSDNTPQRLMLDFYSILQKERSKRRKGTHIYQAWNMLSDDIKQYYENLVGGITGKNYFYNFWDEEAEEFVILKQSPLEKNIGSITKMSFTICYKRNVQYAKQRKSKQNPDASLENSFCSVDTYHLIKKPENDSPYLWSMDRFESKKCESSETIKMCDEKYGKE